MAIQSCPACRQLTVKHLGGLSGLTIVDYYRCTTCGHVWSSQQVDGTNVLDPPAPTEKNPPRTDS